MKKDIWDQASSNSKLSAPDSPVVAANGAELDIVGKTVVLLEVGGLQTEFAVLVARTLTQDCILGADFLLHNRCVVDMHRQILLAGGESVRFDLSTRQEMPSTCHVTLLESTTIPAASEVQLPVHLSGEEGVVMHPCLAVLDPSQEFSERHGVLIAHSLSYTGAEKTLVQVLNPSPAPVLVHRHEKIGRLLPLEGAQVVCTVDPFPERKLPTSRDIEGAIEMLIEKAECPTASDREQLQSLLLEFSDIISTGDDNLGRTDLVRHKIDTGEATPVRLPARRLPFQQRREVHELLDKMLKRDVIEEAHGPWSSPIVLVKKDGSTRFCVDFRKINNFTKKDAHPLPRIDDTLDTLGEAKWFSTLDLASDYWQVEVDPNDKPKTAFSTPFGLYQFRVMPFGLCNAPATFQRLMERVLRGLHWTTCLVYIDDVIIFSGTIGEHLQHLAEVFSRLRDAKLKIKPSKCHLLRQSVHYLGHIISQRGVETDPDKVRVIAAWPAPTSCKELRQFLGLASYYRRFVKGFAQIASPLFKLTENNKKWQWEEDCNQAFLHLKNKLTSTPVLALPNFKLCFTLDVDASGKGLGAVLSQKANAGGEQVIACAS